MIDLKKQVHIVQSKEWNKFKQQYGTKVLKFDDIYFLVKKIPLTNKYMAYAPKVNFLVQKVNFKKLKLFLKDSNIAFIRFDVPNILKNTSQGKLWNKKLSKLCKKSPRNTFTQKNFYLNLTPSTEELLKNMHQKRRYNIKYAKRKGVKINISTTVEAFDTFYNLHSETAKRQKFLTHNKKYFGAIYKNLKPYFVEAVVGNRVVTSWMIIKLNETIYYIYGGSLGIHNNLHPNELVGFSAITLGKDLNAKYFDMWGAEEGKGFHDFKIKFGAKLVEYIPSYDFVVNKFEYSLFNLMYQSFWALQGIKRKIF